MLRITLCAVKTIVGISISVHVPLAAIAKNLELRPIKK
jgi:hypothetical protein